MSGYFDALEIVERAAERWSSRKYHDNKKFDGEERDPVGEGVLRSRQPNATRRFSVKREDRKFAKEFFGVEVAAQVEQDLVLDADGISSAVSSALGFNPKSKGVTLKEGLTLLEDFITNRNGVRDEAVEAVQNLYRAKYPELPDTKLDAIGIFAGNAVAQLLVRASFTLSGKSLPQAQRMFAAVVNNVEGLTAFNGYLADTGRIAGQLLNFRAKTFEGANLDLVDDFRRAAANLLKERAGTDVVEFINSLNEGRKTALENAVESAGEDSGMTVAKEELFESYKQPLS